MLKRISGLIILMNLVLGFAAQAEAAWYNPAWGYRKEITIQNGQVTADLNNFPVLISIVNDTNLRDNVSQADGSDIIFTESDGTTLLKREIESYDAATGTLVAWVKVDVKDLADVDIYMYYSGNSTANDTATWDINYVMVQHMKDATTSTITDSTSNANNGAKIAANEPIEADGQIAEAQSFDGSNDYVVIPSSVSLDGLSTDATFSFWVNMEREWSNNEAFIALNYAVTANCYINKWASHIYATIGGGQIYSNSANLFSLNEWHFMSVVKDGAIVKLYLDGGAVDVGKIGAHGDISSSGISWVIGNLRDGSTDQPLDGRMDEVRVSNTARTPNWIKTSYNSQNSPSTFYVVGSQEAGGITISGTIYTNEEKSTNVGIGVTVGLSVNGGAKTQTTTTAGGAFSFTGVSINSDNTVTIFIDDDVSYEGNLIGQAVDGATNITGLEMYTNKIVLRHETAGPMTNALLAIADDSGDDDIHYTVTGADVDFDDTYEAWIDSAKAYTPGGTVEADGLEVSGTGTFNPQANSVSIHGDLKLSATGGFTSSGTVTLNGSTDQALTTANQAFFNLTLNNTGTDGNDDIVVSGNLDINGKLTITNGDLDCNTNNPNLFLSGDFEIGASGAFTKGTGILTFDGSTAFTDNTSPKQNLGTVKVD